MRPLVCFVFVVLDMTSRGQLTRDEVNVTHTPSLAQEVNFTLTDATTESVSFSAVDYSCDSESEVFRKNLEDCLKKGHRFVRRLLRWMRDGGGDFDKCKFFHAFEDCITPVLDECPSIRQSFEDWWGLIYKQYHCTCSRKEDSLECGLAAVCLEDQYATYFRRRCDALTQFNLDQGTRNRCFFFSEGLHCKDTLLTSACGDQSGRLIFDLSRVSIQRKLEMNGCDIRRNIHHQGFRHTVQCPVQLAEHFDSCYEESFWEHFLTFNSDNDLVASGGRRDVTRACRSLSAYNRCVAPLVSTCPEGSDRVFELNDRARTYLLKMEFICEKAQDEYAKHLLCYQEVLHNRTLERCHPIWNNLQPALHSLTAVQFYCVTAQPQALQVHKALSDLQQCYGDVYRASCGPAGGWVMNSLIQEAFKDPFYMRLRFRPDCTLHGLKTKEFDGSWTNYTVTEVHVKPTKYHDRLEPDNNGTRTRNEKINSLITLLSLFVISWYCNDVYSVHR